MEITAKITMHSKLIRQVETWKLYWHGIDCHLQKTTTKNKTKQKQNTKINSLQRKKGLQ